MLVLIYKNNLDHLLTKLNGALKTYSPLSRATPDYKAFCRYRALTPVRLSRHDSSMKIGFW